MTRDDYALLKACLRPGGASSGCIWYIICVQLATLNYTKPQATMMRQSIPHTPFARTQFHSQCHSQLSPVQIGALSFGDVRRCRLFIDSFPVLPISLSPSQPPFATPLCMFDRVSCSELICMLISSSSSASVASIVPYTELGCSVSVSY